MQKAQHLFDMSEQPNNTEVESLVSQLPVSVTPWIRSSEHICLNNCGHPNSISTLKQWFWTKFPTHSRLFCPLTFIDASANSPSVCKIPWTNRNWRKFYKWRGYRMGKVSWNGEEKKRGRKSTKEEDQRWEKATESARRVKQPRNEEHRKTYMYMPENLW